MHGNVCSQLHTAIFCVIYPMLLVQSIMVPKSPNLFLHPGYHQKYVSREFVLEETYLKSTTLWNIYWNYILENLFSKNHSSKATSKAQISVTCPQSSTPGSLTLKNKSWNIVINVPIWGIIILSVFTVAIVVLLGIWYCKRQHPG